MSHPSSGPHPPWAWVLNCIKGRPRASKDIHLSLSPGGMAPDLLAQAPTAMTLPPGLYP